MKIIRHLLVIFMLLQSVTGCANGRGAFISNDVDYQADLSCAYFYFLQGAHAEYEQKFEEALEAYEKALICDPAATYIEKKIPVLLFRLGEMERAAETLKSAIARDPEDVTQYLLLAHLHIQQNKRDEAIGLYRKVLELDPDNESVLLRLGILTVQQEQYAEAEKIFRDLIRDNPDLYFARVYLARLLHMRGSDKKAAKVYEEALRLNWSPELVFEMVDFYSSQERHEDVLRLYTTVIQNDETNERAILGRVQALLSLHRDQQALDELLKLRETRSNTVRLDMAISKILLRLGKIREAAETLEELRSGEAGSEANYLLGLIAYQAKQAEKSLGYLKEVLPEADEYTDAVYLQVRIFRDLGMIGNAVKLLQEATSNPASQHPLFYALLSAIYQEQKKIEEAMASIMAGTAAFPQSEELHFEHALLLEKSGLTDRALTVMQRVLELSPDNPEALNYIGYTWADRNVNLQKALQYIRRAVELKPDNGFIRDSLGWVHYRLGDYDNALQELQHALELEPQDPHIYEHLGDVYRALDRTEDALDAYRKGLEMFEDQAEREAIQNKLDELKNH